MADGSAALQRRVVLRGVAAAGILGVTGSALAACGSDGTATTGAAASTPTTEPTGAPASTAATPDAGATTAAVDGIASTSEVPVEGGTIVDDVVLTQPAEGEFKAFDAMCTHQGCNVSNVESGTINCTCHGSRFDIADGSVVSGPAPRPLESIPVTVVGTELVLG